MPEDFEKTKKEQEQKRELWREQQKARMGVTLPEKPPTAGKIVGSSIGAELSEGRGPRAIATRLRAARARELAGGRGMAGLAGVVPGGEMLAKAEEIKKSIQRLQNIYRVINGAAGVTVWGLILTFLVMNAQLIFGNLLKARLIPKLGLPEILVIGVIDFIILTALAIQAVFITIMVLAISNPSEIFKLLWEGSWSAIKDLF